MKLKIAAITLALLGLGVGALGLKAQVVANRPGVMTEARVWIQNRGRGEAVPVAIEDAKTLTVRLAGPATLSLEPDSRVSTQRARQAWEYRTVRVPADQDAAAALGAAGRDGWEAVGVAAADQTATTFLMKRPAP